jgi:hypothetical protein
MFEWWDSLESVTRFRWWTSFLAILVPPLLGSILGGLAWRSGNRRDYLKTQQEQELAKPRHLSPEQREQFVAILREVPSGIGIQSPNDPEAITFAGELRACFTDAGWWGGGFRGTPPMTPQCTEF